MKRILVMMLVALLTASATNAQTSGNKRNKCTTCGKLITACQYHGMHTVTTPKPKPSPGSKSEQTTTTSSPTPPKRGYINGYEWVDLGLSVKWATCNVGASSPSDQGYKYAWGETSTKSRYAWDNYFDCLDSTGDSWRTYKIGGQTRITPSSGHDTARVNWGGTWRMPTYAEIRELFKCKWTFTSMDGHNGYVVTGPNGNSIFLPTADFDGRIGWYWSSTLSPEDSRYARDLMLLFDGQNIGHGERSVGKSVRPVTE